LDAGIADAESINSNAVKPMSVNFESGVTGFQQPLR